MDRKNETRKRKLHWETVKKIEEINVNIGAYGKWKHCRHTHIRVCALPSERTHARKAAVRTTYA